ncbi:cache domain-containing protein [Delftia sp. PS-11]|uniref:cache domain-containing protein n=1 Tax=Delftia sp. PS-11 TaxID=2767222 RepID=UPI0024561CAD|nr:cache domain-containing protein [Delftia sp. PS-11]KAJ8746571.1 cache domain-containing protein [Delftia sp. PS-11]
MQLPLKFALLSILAMLAALGLVAATVQHQTLALAHQERELVEAAYLHSKETELRHYVQLASSALARIQAGGEDTPALQRLALDTLAQMRFGEDGYFFVYDGDGKVLLDPLQMGLAGVDLCDPGSPASAGPANRILDKARSGGGIVHYNWHKPSSQRMVDKLGYVTTVPAWGWSLGTGLYLDDVQEALRKIDESAQANIEATRWRILGIAALGIVLIGVAGMALYLSDHRISSSKLQQLAQRVVRSQEEERTRVARELHDGVVQVLVSSKFLLETAQAQLRQLAQQTPGVVPRMVDQGLERINHALLEIRRVSHGLRPALLDDLGLAPALALMSQQMHSDGGTHMRFATHGEARALPGGHATALFRVAQEAVMNAQMHAQAARIEVSLHFQRRRVMLEVHDDGQGFDMGRVQRDGQGGIGLRNMRERIEGLGGRLNIHSGRQGTRLIATLPLEADATASPSHTELAQAAL